MKNEFDSWKYKGVYSHSKAFTVFGLTVCNKLPYLKCK